MTSIPDPPSPATADGARPVSLGEALISIVSLS